MKRSKKNKTVSKKIPPVSPPKQASKRPAWLEKLSKKNVQRLRAKKMTRTVETRSKATIRKTAETESISLPTRLSENSVSASKAQPKKNMANDKSVYDASKTQSVRTEPVKRGKTGKPNDETMDIGHPSFENGRSEEPKRENLNTFVGDKADISGKPACKESNTESVSPPKGSEKPVIAT